MRITSTEGLRYKFERDFHHQDGKQYQKYIGKLERCTTHEEYKNQASLHIPRYLAGEENYLTCDPRDWTLPSDTQYLSQNEEVDVNCYWHGRYQKTPKALFDGGGCCPKCTSTPVDEYRKMLDTCKRELGWTYLGQLKEGERVGLQWFILGCVNCIQNLSPEEVEEQARRYRLLYGRDCGTNSLLKLKNYITKIVVENEGQLSELSLKLEKQIDLELVALVEEAVVNMDLTNLNPTAKNRERALGRKVGIALKTVFSDAVTVHSLRNIMSLIKEFAIGQEPTHIVCQACNSNKGKAQQLSFEELEARINTLGQNLKLLNRDTVQCLTCGFAIPLSPNDTCLNTVMNDVRPICPVCSPHLKGYFTDAQKVAYFKQMVSHYHYPWIIHGVDGWVFDVTCSVHGRRKMHDFTQVKLPSSRCGCKENISEGAKLAFDVDELVSFFKQYTTYRLINEPTGFDDELVLSDQDMVTNYESFEAFCREFQYKTSPGVQMFDQMVIREDIFDRNSMTTESAFWLGFLAGDGSRSNNEILNGKNAGNIAKTLGLSQKYHRLNIVAAFCHYVGIDRVLRISKKQYTYDSVRKFSFCIETSFTRSKNHPMFDDLKSFGIDVKKSFELKPPSFPSQQFHLAYLAGLILADGSIYSNNRNHYQIDIAVGIASGSPIMHQYINSQFTKIFGRPVHLYKISSSVKLVVKNTSSSDAMDSLHNMRDVFQRMHSYVPKGIDFKFNKAISKIDNYFRWLENNSHLVRDIGRKFKSVPNDPSS